MKEQYTYISLEELVLLDEIFGIIKVEVTECYPALADNPNQDLNG